MRIIMRIIVVLAVLAVILFNPIEWALGELVVYPVQCISKFGTLFGKERCEAEETFTYVVGATEVTYKSNMVGTGLVHTNCVIDSVLNWSCPPMFERLGTGTMSITLTYPAEVVELGLPIPTGDDCIVGRQYVWKYQWWVIKLGEFLGRLPILLQPARECRRI